MPFFDSYRPLTFGQRFARTLLLAHVFLIASLGDFYSKRSVAGNAPIYPTELVLVTCTMLCITPMLRVRRDAITVFTYLLVALALLWIAIGGIGPLDGIGPKALSFFFYALIYFLIRGTARTEELRQQVLTVIKVAAFAGAALGIAQAMTGTHIFEDSDKFGITTTGSTRWLGGSFALYGMFTCSIVFVELILKGRLRWVSILAGAAGSAEIILAQHRSGFLALALALAGTALLLRATRRMLRRVELAIAVGILAIGVLWVFAGGEVGDTATRIAHTGDLEDENIVWRALAWKEVGDGVLHNPLGHGFATWTFKFNENDPLSGSHNSFLDLTYRIGVPGLIVFLTLPITLIRRTRKAILKLPAIYTMSAVTSVCCLFALMAFASFNVVFETPHMAIFFWLFLGIGTEATSQTLQSAAANEAAGRQSLADALADRTID